MNHTKKKKHTTKQDGTKYFKVIKRQHFLPFVYFNQFCFLQRNENLFKNYQCDSKYKTIKIEYLFTILVLSNIFHNIP